MNTNNRLIKIIVAFFVPLAILVWGMFSFSFFDTFYVRSVDPEYPYLINGLNCALLRFDRIGHIDHPGTPFQMFCGLVIQIVYLFTGSDGMFQDVINHPDFYLGSINVALLIIQTALVFIIAVLSIKRNVGMLQMLVLQLGVLMNYLLIEIFPRVFPERWLAVSTLLFIVVYLKYGYQNRNLLKFAIWSGVVMGMGFATKFNYLPIILLPLFMIKTTKHKLIYAGSGIASFLLFVSPIIRRFNEYRNFIKGIATHDGIYGQGESQMFNVEVMKQNLFSVLDVAPELAVIVTMLLVCLVLCLIFRKRTSPEYGILFFIGSLFVVAIQLLMVAKHFKNYYLVPLMTIYPLLFFVTIESVNKLFGKKWLAFPVYAIVLILMLFSVKRGVDYYPDCKAALELREAQFNAFAENVPSDAVLFVEPTWESAPFVENGLIYGFSYCRNKHVYYDQLVKSYPNVITYEGNENMVRSWRIKDVFLDSIVTTGRSLFIYSTPGRSADKMMTMVRDVADVNNFEMSIDTVFAQYETQSYIISMKAENVSSDWKLNVRQKSRQEKIDEMAMAIRNSPQWLESVKAKAESNNIPLDSMIVLDAIWMIDNQK